MRQTAPPTGLATPLRFVKGIGPRRAELLEKKGLLTVEDALYNVPLRHEDRTRTTPFSALKPGEAATCSGVVMGVSPPPPGSRAPLTAMLRDASGYVTASWFGRTWLRRTLARGQRLMLHGKVEVFRGRIVLSNPDVEVIESDEDATLHAGRLVPVYSTTEGLTGTLLRRLMWTIVDAYAAEVPEILPEPVRARRSLVTLPVALRDFHFPATEAALAAARRRLAFDDFLFLQTGLAILRARTARARGVPLRPDGMLVSRLLQRLPYRLTGAQERVWDEIRRDLALPHPMHRLLQGDVGSGKTIVAALAVLTAIEAGYQAAVMAPTEILAEQHFLTFRQLLEPLGVSVALLSAAALRGRARGARTAAVAAGEVGCVVGTHALVQEAVAFRRLGLVVVDEQHRFGVAQRARLRAKGEHPHVLVMTATPIPRTLALTLHGDLDVSVLDELPPGRRPVTTVARPESKRPAVHAFVREQVAAGRQAYIVYPLVEESEAVDVAAATEMAARLQQEVFADLRVGLLHGRLPFDEKEAIMARFKAGEIHVLVATTVIEVGIDVPNASIMVIEHAERFGLSQLHQLRGRVGRGPWKSYCVLLHGPRPTAEARRRLEAMVQTGDGFRIAEADLAIRGPGDFFGTRQSGLPEFRVADLLRDAALLEEARAEAQAIVARDPDLRDPAHRGLRQVLLARWRGKLALASVG